MSASAQKIPSSRNNRFIEFPRIYDPRGSLTFIESVNHLPFEIERVYYLTDIPHGTDRGGHAHKALHQVLLAVSGSFDVILDDGLQKECHTLENSAHGLYLPPMTWRDLRNFSENAACLVLASAPYDEADYIREYDEFVSF
ncbi:UNVERIFIED_CONTAM: hypothetical protein GTU68_051549, partial [Idotea baltica]|nr:hypothetical protein [Idotea baltica]